MTRNEEYIICDIDGCISDDRWRRYMLPDRAVGQASYDRYHSYAHIDSPVEEVVAEVRAQCAAAEGSYVLLFVTARPDRGWLRDSTIRWLKESFAGFDFDLLMRPGDSLDSSPVVKMRLLNEVFEGRHASPAAGWDRVVAAFDDRRDVLLTYPIPPRARFLRELPARLTADDVSAVIANLTEKVGDGL